MVEKDPNAEPKHYQLLGRKLVQYDDLLNVLFQLGNSLKEPANELEAVRGSAETLAAIIEQCGKQHNVNYELAFYSAANGQNDVSLNLAWPEDNETLPSQLPQRVSQEPNTLTFGKVSDRKSYEYWHRSMSGVAWALVVYTGCHDHFHSLVSSSLGLFANCLAGISATREREQVASAARLEALRDAYSRLLDEHKLILGWEIQEIREHRIALHEELGKLDTELRKNDITLETRANWLTNVHAALERMDKSFDQLSDTASGMRPDFMGIREQFRANDDDLHHTTLGEILGTDPPIERDGKSPGQFWIKTRPKVLSGALNFLRGVLLELTNQETQEESPAFVNKILTKSVVRQDGGLQIDLTIANGNPRQELSDLLKMLVDPGEWVDRNGGNRAFPLALQGVLSYLEKLKIGTVAKKNGFSLILPREIVQLAEADNKN